MMAEEKKELTKEEKFQDIATAVKGKKINISGADLNSEILHFYKTGFLPLDIILSGGSGFPSGRVVELFGWTGGGKSTLALFFTMAFTNYWKSLNQEYIVLWIESESVFDKARAKYIGCDMENFFVSEVDTVEDGFTLMNKVQEKCTKHNIKLFIVWDTIAAVRTLNQKNTGEFAGGMMEKPRVIWSSLKQITPQLAQNHTALVLVNQVYSNLSGGYESPGGGGIKFFSSIRLDVKQIQEVIETLPSGKDVSKAIVSELKAIKNKITLPKQAIDMYIKGESGFDLQESEFRFYTQSQIFVPSGSWKKIVIGTEEYAFQNYEGYIEKLQGVSGVDSLLTYQTYLYYANISPLMKVNLIDKIWEYENDKFGEKKTELTSKEVEVAKFISESLKAEIEKDEAKLLASPLTTTSEEDKETKNGS